MSVTISTASRLNFSSLVSVDDVDQWDLPTLGEIPQRPDDTFHRVTTLDRLDLLSQDYYGSTRYWWVIALANGLDLNPVDLQVDSVLRIPSKTYVLGGLVG